MISSHLTTIKFSCFHFYPQQPRVISQWEGFTAHSPPIRGPGHIWQPKRLWAGRGLGCHMCTGQPPITDGAEWGETEPELSSPQPRVHGSSHLSRRRLKTEHLEFHSTLTHVKTGLVHYLGENIFRDKTILSLWFFKTATKNWEKHMNFGLWPKRYCRFLYSKQICDKSDLWTCENIQFNGWWIYECTSFIMFSKLIHLQSFQVKSGLLFTADIITMT